MRLWIFNREFPPTGDKHNTGVIKAVHGLAAGLAEAGQEVTVLCENVEDSVYASPAGYTVRCFANPKHNRPFSTLSSGMKQFIASADYPVVALLNGIFNPSVYRMSRELRKARIPYVVAPHDPYHPEIFRRRRIVKSIYWHLFESKLLRQARCVQVLDQRHEHWLRRLDITTPVIECQNGFFLEDLNSIPTPSWDEDAKTKLLFLGRLDTHNKGIDLLIESFKGVADAHDAVHLTIQGPDWGDRQRVLNMIAAGDLQSRITVKDADYNTRSPVIIARHDIFCLPSRFEGFGLSALEAMLAGRVLLVTDIAGIAPHVRNSDCGVVVDPSVASVRSGILQLLERRSQWREMGLRGRQYAIENLRWDRIAAKVAQEYRAMLPAVGAASQPAMTAARRVGEAFKEVEKVPVPGRMGS
jgi:glycosyltransferase involved in cell wall biosynthesis